MEAGQPPTETDRRPWLEQLAAELHQAGGAENAAVLACSALSRVSRASLKAANPNLRFVFLEAPRDVIQARLQVRSSHFMPAARLSSQLAALEVPTDAVNVDATQPVDEIVARIVRELS